MKDESAHGSSINGSLIKPKNTRIENAFANVVVLPVPRNVEKTTVLSKLGKKFMLVIMTTIQKACILIILNSYALLLPISFSNASVQL